MALNFCERTLQVRGRIGSSITSESSRQIEVSDQNQCSLLTFALVKEQFTRSKRYLEAANKKRGSEAVKKTEEDICKPMSDVDLTLMMDRCGRYVYSCSQSFSL